jgi:2-iminobutanoate/2-iminopropanoate deaminase
MKRENIAPEGLFEPMGWSHAIKVDNTIYLAGMVGFDEQRNVVDGGFEAQTIKTFENIKLTLEAAGATLKDVVKLTIYVTDMDNIVKFREIRGRYFSPPLPASTGVEVSRLILPELLVEIEAIAVVGN